MALGTLFRLALAVTRQILQHQQYDFDIAVAERLDQEVFGLTQATWFVDPVNGNDQSTGATLLTALKTDAERQRRWGPQTLLTQATTVTYASSPPSSDVVNYNVAYATGASLQVIGTPTITNANVLLTAVTTLNRATQTPWDVTGATLGATDVNRIATINAGTRINNYAAVGKDLTGGKVRTTPWGNVQIDSTTTSVNCLVQVTPLVNDVVDVMTLPVLPVGSIQVRSLTRSVVTNAPLANCVLFDSVELNGAGSGNSLRNGSIAAYGVAMIYYRRCITTRMQYCGDEGHLVAGGILTRPIWTCNSTDFSVSRCLPQALAFLSNDNFTVAPGSHLAMGTDCLFQNSFLAIQGAVTGGFVSSFDAASANTCVQVLEGAFYRSAQFISGTGDLLWGDANNGVAVKILDYGALIYATKPTINLAQGAGRASLIGGVNTDWAAVPAITAANNAGIVLRVT